MEFIKPPEIASKIMTLMDEAEERIIIISPYNKLSNWKKIRNHFEKAQARGVTIEYYIRANEKGNKEEVRQLGIEPVEIDNLHAKVYLNDETAIVTSLNLHQFSDENSIDIGYKTETAEEYKEVYEFYTRYVVSEINKEIIVDYNQSSIDGFLEYFFNSLVTIYTKYAFTIKEPRSSDWGSIICDNFHIEGLNLELVVKGNYFRIDFRLRMEYKLRKKIYDHLYQNKDVIEKKLGYPINWGNEMKRLKIDLTEFPVEKIEKWSDSDVKFINGYIQRAFTVIKPLIS